MLLQDTIGEHLLEVDKAAREREEVILKQLTCIFICAMLMKILKDKERVFSKQLFWITPFGVKAIRTAGSTADRRRKLPLLIERYSSNFISWFLYNHEIARNTVQTCETVNKSSKSMIAI